MTPAETLRAAAKLMRERAESATPGTWRAFSAGQPDDCDWYVVSAPYGQITSGLHTAGDDEDVTELVLLERDHHDAEHIASWPPGVALAAAALLDKLAWMGEIDPDLLGRVGCDEAIAFARAYLGEGE